MKLWYSATEVRLQQMDAELKARKAELDSMAIQQTRENAHEGRVAGIIQANYQTVLELQTKNAQDAAQSVVENAKNVAELTERIVKLTAENADNEARVSELENRLQHSEADRSALLATVTEMARNPKIITKETQTATAVVGSTYIVQEGKVVPIVKV